MVLSVERVIAVAAVLQNSVVEMCIRDRLFDTPETCFGIEICEDMWAPIPPSSALALKGAEIIFNMSADNEGIGKHNYVLSLIHI